MHQPNISGERALGQYNIGGSPGDISEEPVTYSSICMIDIENISFEAKLITKINKTNIPPKEGLENEL